MADLKEREERVRLYLKKLGLDKKTDLAIVLTTRVKYGSTHTLIKVNPDLPDDQFDVTLAHELLHYFGIAHNETSRSIKFHSTNLRKDLLSKTLAEMMKS